MAAAHFWKKSFALALLMANASIFADDVDSRLSTLESRINAIKMETPKGTVGARMASANPLYDGYNLFLTADLLYWKLYEGGTDYSLSREVSGPQSFPKVSGKSSRVNFDWDFGFRIGAGYDFEHDAWEALFNFTWFRTEGSGHAHADSDETLVLEKGSLNSVSATRIKAHWEVHDYVLDLELARKYFVSAFLALRPQIGIEIAWIHQRRHFTMDMPLDPSTHIDGESVRGKCHFWGIGPRAGIESSWFLGKHYSLFGAFNGALLWGKFDTDQKEKDATSSGTADRLTASDHFHRLVPNAQIAAGISWDGNLKEDRFHLGITLSYEFQYWWRQNQFLDERQSSLFGLQPESHNMMLNGVTLNVRFDF